MLIMAKEIPLLSPDDCSPVGTSGGDRTGADEARAFGAGMVPKPSPGPKSTFKKGGADLPDGSSAAVWTPFGDQEAEVGRLHLATPVQVRIALAGAAPLGEENPQIRGIDESISIQIGHTIGRGPEVGGGVIERANSDLSTHQPPRKIIDPGMDAPPDSTE